MALLGACSSETAEVGSADEAASALGTLGCPTALVKHNLGAAQGPGWWQVDEQQCAAFGKSVFDSPVRFESYLSKHPHSSLGLDVAPVNLCFARYLVANNGEAQRFDRLSLEKQDYTQRAIVSDYYYTMNTIRQATRGTLEALSAMDLLLGVVPTLPATSLDANERSYTTRYSSPLAVDSAEWSAGLRKCKQPSASPAGVLETETRDNLVFMTYTRTVIDLIKRDVATMTKAKSGFTLPKVWYKQWTDEGKLRHFAELDARIAQFGADIETLEQQLAGHKALTPWLSGSQMSGVYDKWAILGVNTTGRGGVNAVESAQNQFASMTPEALMRHVAAKVDARMSAKWGSRAPIRTMLVAQVRANRKLLAEKLEELYRAAECLHGNSTSCLDDVNDVMETWPAFDSTGFKADELPEDVEVMQRLLASSNPRERDLGERLQKKRARASASISGMFAAECRSQVRVQNQKIVEARNSLIQGIAITIATAGLGSWLAASKAGLVAAQAAGQAARAAALTQRVIALNGVLLAADTYWLGEGVVSSVQACSQYISHNLENPAVSPLGSDAPYCREGQEALGTNDLQAALSPTAVSNYRACAFEASFSIGLNTLGILPSIYGMKSALKGK